MISVEPYLPVWSTWTICSTLASCETGYRQRRRENCTQEENCGCVQTEACVNTCEDQGRKFCELKFMIGRVIIFA